MAEASRVSEFRRPPSALLIPRSRMRCASTMRVEHHVHGVEHPARGRPPPASGARPASRAPAIRGGRRCGGWAGSGARGVRRGHRRTIASTLSSRGGAAGWRGPPSPPSPPRPARPGPCRPRRGRGTGSTRRRAAACTCRSSGRRRRRGSAWVPRSTTRPASITRICSARRMVESRCAITNVVRPRMRWASPSWMSASDSESRLEVASSRIRMRGSARIARAMETRCRWPPESLTPRSPTTVSYPSSNCSANSSTRARRQALQHLLLARPPAARRRRSRGWCRRRGTCPGGRRRAGAGRSRGAPSRGPRRRP